jgi:DNA-binding beta-propeller fold protein YncE
VIRLRALRRLPHPSASALLLAFALGFAVTAPSPAGAVGGIGDLFITSDASDRVRAYGGNSGNYLGLFALSTLGSGELGLHFGSNGRVLVGHIGGGVDEYDAATGGYIKTYAPGGSWQWTAVYAPNGNVYIGSHGTNDIREYDSTTGAFISIKCSLPTPSDMEYGPNGNLYVGSYFFGTVYELDPNTLATVSSWPVPGQPNDIAFLPGGRILVTAQSTIQCYVFDAAHNPITSFAGTGWGHPHGIAISPYTGNILIVDGVTTQVHEFDPNTYAELNPAYLTPNPGDKIVDLAFRPDHQGTPATPTTWGRVKALWR